MLEYVGVWEWYDKQIKLFQTIIRIKKSKLVDRRGVSIYVLNGILGPERRSEQPGKWIRGIGRLILGKDEDEFDISPESHDAGIAKRARQLQRKCVSMQLSRGNKLSTKLIKELGLGILFSPKIW
jgi:hypothetical protein